MAGLMQIRTDTQSTRRLDENLLIAMPPFKGLDAREVRNVLDQASLCHHDPETAVFREGFDADRFYLLLDGYIRVVKISAEGDQVIVLHIPSGELFGIAKALEYETYPATAITVTHAVTLSWPMSLWESFVSKYAGFAARTFKTVGARVSEMKDRIVEMSTQQVDQRIANAVLRLINQSGRKIDDVIEIDFPITRQDISNMTGTTLHTVSRTMSKWEKQGLIESRRKKIVVRDAHSIVILSGAAH